MAQERTTYPLDRPGRYGTGDEPPSGATDGTPRSHLEGLDPEGADRFVRESDLRTLRRNASAIPQRSSFR